MTPDHDHAPIGNSSISAQIDRRGRFVWACAPRVDGDPVFSALMDGTEPEHGFWDVELEGQKPVMAHEALKMEPHVGVMLPCNVVVQQAENGAEVFAVDPAASMRAIDNAELLNHAKAVGEHLRAAVADV